VQIRNRKTGAEDREEIERVLEIKEKVLETCARLGNRIPASLTRKGSGRR
jgi:hypothetical protein